MPGSKHDVKNIPLISKINIDLNPAGFILSPELNTTLDHDYNPLDELANRDSGRIRKS
jgi:hypothetical protein